MVRYKDEFAYYIFVINRWLGTNQIHISISWHYCFACMHKYSTNYELC